MPNMKRDNKWQALRGICIIAVVLIHCAHYVKWDGTVNSFIFFLYRNLINFPVAVFMFLSGYFAKPDYSRIGQFYKDRIIRLIVPYCSWTIIYLFLRSTLAGNKFDIYTLLLSFLLGKVAAPFYYIIVLFYFTLATPFLVRYVKDVVRSIAVLLVSLAFGVVIYVLQLVYGFNIFYVLKYTPIWLVFYYFGILCKRNQLILDKFQSLIKYSPLLFLFCYSLELLGTYCFLHVGNGQVIAYSQLRISGFLYAVSVICTFLWLYCKRNSDNWLVYLGNNSYGIFYIHCLGILLARKLVKLRDLPFIVNVLIEFIFAFGLSLCLIYCINKIGNKRLKALLGI